jgi:Asp/Glu/hydantoin racemase
LTTSRALETGAKYILLGFVGQPNLEETVRRAAGRNAMVIDGAKAGAEVLVGLVRSQT